MTATLATKEDEIETSAPPRRSGPASTVAPAAGQTARSYLPASEVITSLAVSGPAGVDTSVLQTTASVTPAETAAARQVVKIDTLLQNALNVGESVRPDGQGHLEMRVRLGDGAEDVTVRLLVSNDKLQVTFQTNSPDLSKALESGWQQFSATAAQASTLSLASPRFESSGVTDSQSFFAGEQDSRRQQPADEFADESLPPTTSGRAASATVTAAGAAARRRWNRWA